MKKNIQDVLSRGDRLDEIGRQSTQLREKSKKFKWGAKKLNMQEWLRRYAPVIGLGSVLVMVFYYKFLL
jgi:vesicle transport protein SEC22